MAKHKPGSIVNVKMKNGTTRRARVLATGMFRFLPGKGSTSSSTSAPRTTSSKGARKARSTASKKKSKGGRKGGRTFGVASVLAGINAVIQYGAPLIPAVDQLRQKNLAGAAEAAKTGIKESMSLSNHIEALGPVIGVAAVKGAAKMVGYKNRRVVGKFAPL